MTAPAPPVRPAGPQAILIGGPPATGKSTLAAAVAPRLGAALLDLDVATNPLTTVVSGLVGRADLSDPRLAELTRTARYDTLYDLAVDNLRAGLSVVLVAPFTTERSTAGWNAVVRRLSPVTSRVTMLWLHLPPDDLVDRLTRRAAVRDADKRKNPAAFLSTLDLRPPDAPHIPLDARRPIHDLVALVIDNLARPDVAIDGNA